MTNGMFDSIYEAAIQGEVAVDEFTDFSREQPHCHYCGSYDLHEVCRKQGDKVHSPVIHMHWICEDCGTKVRKERAEELRGKTYIGPSEDGYWR